MINKIKKRKGHIAWNKDLTKETDERIMNQAIIHSKTKKRLFSEGELVSHNKGKTKENYEPLKRTSEKLKECKRSLETRKKISKTRKRLIEEGKIPRINSGCFKKGQIPWITGKKHTEKTRKKMSEKWDYDKHFNEKIIGKMSKSKKESYKSGELKGCFEKGHLPHGAGKTKENYEPLQKAGKEISNTKNSEEWRNTKGLIARKKMSASKQDISLEQWKNFKSFEPYDESFNTKFKNQIRKRDNQACMNCGTHREKLNKALDAHHINYDKLLSIPENCISLCRKCHSLTNINREYWKKLFQDKLSRLYGYKYSETGEIILNLNKLNKEEKTKC